MIKLLHCTFLTLITIANSLLAQEKSIIFLHHSTGRMVYENGHVADSIEAYNKRHGTDYNIREKNFPYKPYAWKNYPYDYWNIWLDGYCEQYKNEETYNNVKCLEDLCAEYDVIIFKHCFPGADVLENTGQPDISSDRKSIENYKLQYRALRDKFSEFPENDFILWTLVPRHRLYKDAPTNAPRAKEFVDWVNNEWLDETDVPHNNIHIFDYFSYAAETDITVLPPKVPYCLKYKYEKDHNDNDSHPNKLACQEIGMKFYEFIIETVEKDN